MQLYEVLVPTIMRGKPVRLRLSAIDRRTNERTVYDYRIAA
jgi:hypothetical protein